MADLKCSIVTVCLNPGPLLEKTLKSIFSQNYLSYEPIVVDGGSTDGTQDTILRYQEKIGKWISESDSGLYDAMNKGVALASGEWIIFMNCGDVFSDDSVLQRIFESGVVDQSDVVYGDSFVRYPDGVTRLVRTRRPLSTMWKGMVFNHQSVFVKKSILEKYPFDTRFRLAADFNLLFKIYNLSYPFVYFPYPISVVTSGGVSDTDRTRVFNEYMEIVLTYGSQFFLKRIFVVLFYQSCILVNLVKKWLKNRLTPTQVTYVRQYLFRARVSDDSN